MGEGALQLRAHLSLPCPFLHFRKGLASTSTRVRPAAPPNLPPLTPPRNWPARSIPARLAQFCAVNPSSRVNPSGDCGAAPPPRAAILPSDPLARADPPLPRPRSRRGRSPRRSHEPPACSPARQPFPEPLPDHGCHRLRKSGVLQTRGGQSEATSGRSEAPQLVSGRTAQTSCPARRGPAHFPPRRPAPSAPPRHWPGEPSLGLRLPEKGGPAAPAQAQRRGDPPRRRGGGVGGPWAGGSSVRVWASRRLPSRSTLDATPGPTGSRAPGPQGRGGAARPA